MATNFSTSTSNAQREDLANFISNITRDETPFMSSIGKTKATATKHQWSTDTLAVPAANVNAEGAGFPADVSEGPEIATLDNATQIFTKTVEVSGSIESVNKAGRKSEFKYQSEKRGKELMRDIEFALVGTTAALASDATYGSTRVMQGVQKFMVNTKTSSVSGGFSLTDIDHIMQTCYEEGGKPTTIMMGTSNKRAFSVMAQAGGLSGAGTGNVRRNIDDDGKLRQSVELYETDFGTVKVVPNYICSDTEVIAYDPSNYKMATLRPLHHRDISEDGDRLRALMVHETTLEVAAPNASGLVINGT